jgi:hypothetical protein
MSFVPRLLVFATCVLIGSAFSQAQPISFNRDIRPILSENCFHCHGPDKESRDSGLRLDIREEAIKPAKSDAIAIVPGKIEESELVLRILSEDKDEIMPPPKAHKTLTAAQKDLLKRWIAEGAVYEPHWAYSAIVRPPLPTAKGAAEAQGDGAKASSAVSPIDALIQAQLAEKKILPAPAADPATLIRRLSLDLTGLPPTPEEVAAFVRESQEETQVKSAPVVGIQSSQPYPEPAVHRAAYDRLVDRLLASPRYGERMAQQWLDLARYADSVGFHGDQGQPVWAYRDWVIDAYNANMPFDQFTTEQLAGDLLPNPTPSQLIATCFNRLNMVTREGGAQTKEYLIKYTADRTRTVGTTWLGSTVGCAECHDHKFDPWSQKDVYSLGAFFADVKQWGVYHDYSSSPNPDLAGWSNDHPFPPELIVESAALKRRIEAAKAQISEAVRSAEAPPETFAEWQSATLKFLEQHASGWEIPKAALTVKTAQPEAKQDADGRVVMEVKPTREIQADLQPSARWLAAVKIELLPDSKHGNRVLRVDGDDRLRPEFELVRDGKPTTIGIRLAQADRNAPRYFNGFEIPGVKDEWKIAGKDATAAHTAVYFSCTPVALYRRVITVRGA